MVKYVRNPDWKHKKHVVQNAHRLRELAQVSIMRSNTSDKVKEQ